MFSNKRCKASNLVYEEVWSLNPVRLHSSAHPHKREPRKTRSINSALPHFAADSQSIRLLCGSSLFISLEAWHQQHAQLRVLCRARPA